VTISNIYLVQEKETLPDLSAIFYVFLCQVLIYCQSLVWPQHKWLDKKKIFTMDVVYLHDKPGPENRPSWYMTPLWMLSTKCHSMRVTSLRVARDWHMFYFDICVSCWQLTHPIQWCAQDMPRSIMKPLLVVWMGPWENICGNILISLNNEEIKFVACQVWRLWCMFRPE
jgi:hypothetical protein